MSFRTLGPWTPPEQPPAPPPRVRFWQVAPVMMGNILVIGTALLARVNLRAGRGDRRAAFRLFAVTLLIWIAAWIIGARHYGSIPTEDDRFYGFVNLALTNSVILWLFYVALEPYVRRFTPRILISSTRALAGQIVDARVGRDLLLGITVGTGMGILGFMSMIVPVLLGEPPPTPRSTNLQFLMGSAATIGSVLRMLPNAFQTAAAIGVAFAFGRALLRNTFGASLIAAAMLGVFVFESVSWDRPYLTVFTVLAFLVPMVATLIYGGLLASAAAFFVNQVLSNAPLTLNMSSPHVAGAMWPMMLVLGLAVFGFYASRSGQPLFGRLLRAD